MDLEETHSCSMLAYLALFLVVTPDGRSWEDKSSEHQAPGVQSQDPFSFHCPHFPLHTLVSTFQPAQSFPYPLPRRSLLAGPCLLSVIQVQIALEHLFQKPVLSEQSRPGLTMPPAETGTAGTCLLGHAHPSCRDSGGEREQD